MRIHSLDCGTMCPRGGGLMDGNRERAPARLVCHCLLVETVRGLVLVDTGFGVADVVHPTPRLSRFFLGLLRPELDAEQTALRQVTRLGYNAADVRHIVLTHLDFDHAGGLEDFPAARVHTLAREHQAAVHRHGLVARGRYRPRQWARESHWQLYEPDGGGERWHGFEVVRGLVGLPPEILLVPLHGHTLGHAGVAVAGDDGWLLLAGDAYFHHDEMAVPPRCPPGLRAYQRLMEVDRAARLRNQDRLRALANGSSEVTVCCSHDREELAARARLAAPTDLPLAGRPAPARAGRRAPVH